MTSFFFLRSIYKTDLQEDVMPKDPLSLEIHPYPYMRKTGLLALLSMIVGMIVSSFLNLSMAVTILVVVGVFLFFTPDRDTLLSKMDWSVFLLFSGLFIIEDFIIRDPIIFHEAIALMNRLQPNYQGFVIFSLALFVISQLISNVPAAILISQLLPHTTLNLPIFWITAAIITTFAGATTVLGAASNILVIQVSEKRGLKISWWEFTRIGLPLSCLILAEMILSGLVWFKFVV